jgi:hypothetical protein
VHDASASIAWDSGGFYSLHLPSKNDAEEEIHLEVHPDDVQKPWKEQRVRVTYVRVVQKGIDLYDVDLSDYEPEKTAPPRTDPDGLDPDIPPIGPACEAELPHTIHMTVPHTLDDVKFTYKEAVWNPPLIAGTFSQPIPGGVRVIPVDCND